jgi:hypothetical protein
MSDLLGRLSLNSPLPASSYPFQNQSGNRTWSQNVAGSAGGLGQITADAGKRQADINGALEANAESSFLFKVLKDAREKAVA